MSLPQTALSPAPVAVARLIAGGASPDPAEVALLPEPWRGIAEAVVAAVAAGVPPGTAFQEAIAGRADPVMLARQVLAADPQPPRTTLQVWTHDELMAAEFPPFEWVVDGLIPDDSLVLLGGKKKLGKSWLCLQLARAVAAGRPVLERETRQGTVLYVNLEDGLSRLQRRLRRQGEAGDGGSGLYLSAGPLPPLDAEGLEELAALVALFHPRLLILDTLAAAKSGRSDENSAGEMAWLVNQLRLLAQEARCAIVVVAHHRKNVAGGDAGDDIRGSSALAAGADITLGLYRDKAAGYVLRGEGRDIDEVSLRVEFDRGKSFTWQLVGDAHSVARDEHDTAVLEALATLGEADAAGIARKLGRDRRGLARRLKRLQHDGMVTSRQATSRQGLRVLYRLAATDAGEAPPPEDGP